ncbi:acyl-CoA thioester hydrolase/BAAT C-terminal domain-containing protein [Pseudidiomarina homiensis]|uniref:acyl-CoA thioester hydrolase/BAAT C-terminal domain-containing protein n=1 Tax=Pseudidiomarina homiensis TaxID=364198 RepID=UPI00215A2A0E|nr:acyl-CoA thioester hydrolase/BAAT C-terminal domain-containing protein [Pseudidiomarina homiensis]
MRRLLTAIVISVTAMSGCGEKGYPSHLLVEKVATDELKALLVAPKATEPTSTVIVLGGSDGGYQSAAATAQELAEQGIASLAVAYFGIDGVPATLNEIPLEYFSNALKFIDQHPQLSRNQCGQIGVVGSSRGAELALLLGAHNSNFAPIAALSPSSHVWGGAGNTSAAWTFNGEPISYVPRHSNPNYDVTKFVGVDYFRKDLLHPDAAAARIPVADIAGQVLLLAGTDDQLWPSADMARTLEQQFVEAQQPSKVQALYFKDAGHVIAPGAPNNITEVTTPEGTTIVLGGNPTGNQSAQDASLEAMVELFKAPVCRSRPEESKFDQAKLDELRETVKQAGSSSMVLMENGEIAFEFGNIHRKHTMHSIRKAMLNSLYGIYVERGVIDLDKTLAELEIDDIHGLSDTEKSATVRHLLKSRSGVYHPSAATNAAMLAAMPERHSKKPDAHYVYNNWDFNTAGAIFEKLTGENIYEAFAREIAKPLGMLDYQGNYTTISEDTNISKLKVDGFYYYEPEKSKYPAYHMRMSAYDMALYGQLYANNGKWHGQQLISADWIEKSTTSYSVTNSYMDFGYGMLWNVINPNEERATKSFYHTGVGIHMLGVYPASDLVFVHRVATESAYNFDQKNLYRIIGGIWNAR